MSKRRHSNKVPNNMQTYYQSLVELTDPFSQTYLNNDYRQLSQYTVAALCRKKPSPLVSGRIKTWAAGIIHALGTINFLFDKNQSPYMSAAELAGEFGLGTSTVSNKSKQVREILKMQRFDHHWCLPSKLEDHAYAWMIMVNGFIMDARTLAPEIQEAAYEKGLIPYVHADVQVPVVGTIEMLHEKV